MGYPRRKREKKTHSLFKEIIDENFPNLGKKLDIEVEEVKEHLIISTQKHLL